MTMVRSIEELEGALSLANDRGDFWYVTAKSAAGKLETARGQRDFWRSMYMRLLLTTEAAKHAAANPKTTVSSFVHHFNENLVDGEEPITEAEARALLREKGVLV